MQRLECDVLVIGGGGAGLMAAYEASKYKVRVALTNKGKVQRTGATIMAPGAFAAVDDRWKFENDSIGRHIEDTIKGGAFLNDQDKVRLLAENAGKLALELERMGAIFQRDKTGSRYLLRTDGGHSYPRSPFLEDRTGKEMVKAMVSALRKCHVPFYEDIMVTRLLKDDNGIIGAAGVFLRTCEPVLFECKSIVMATGGAGALYANTDNPIDLTGDGYALALEAGASLRDMEFVQFFPIGFLFPEVLKGVIAGVMYYCRLRNANSERFMERYDSGRLELSTRDLVTRAIMQEVREGRGSPRGGVFMDLTYHEPGFLQHMMPGQYALYRNLGIDPEKEFIEVAPTCHFFMGGIDTDLHWQSSLPGLFAAGEVSGGMHGGNRLSQNALAEILVSGSGAGRAAAEHAAKTTRCMVDPGEARSEEALLGCLLSAQSGLSPSSIRARLQTVMWEEVGVFRSEVSLKKALAQLDELEAEPVYIAEKKTYMNRAIMEAIENRNMMITARCLILAALKRTESRGAHWREDFSKTDNVNWCKTILLERRGKDLTVRTRSIICNILEPEV